MASGSFIYAVTLVAIRALCHASVYVVYLPSHLPPQIGPHLHWVVSQRDHGQRAYHVPIVATFCTGYVILAFGCPVLWRSPLQAEIALSTMEAEYVALSMACKDLILLIRELNAAVALMPPLPPTLAHLEPCHMTPCSKHYAIKYQWFCEKVVDLSYCITLVKIDRKYQLGDLFTKGLPLASFVHLQHLLMGW
eukprot:CCRYP_003274-RA/>CCRYP_003274-RA protein AED:0.34 eAED:0.33 QI:0/0/0/1/0/0/2/0/192